MTLLDSGLIIGLIVLLILLFKRGFSILLLLRTILILILILIFVGLVLRYKRVIPPKPEVLVLLDISRSMGEEIDKGKRLLDKKLFKDPSLSVEYFGFSDTIYPLRREGVIGDKTDITKALRFALSKRPGSIVLISDGQHNQPTDPLKVAREANIPIYTIGLGKEMKRDLEIERVILPAKVYTSDTVEVVVRYSSYGFSTEEGRMEILERGSVIGEKRIPLSSDWRENEITFPIIAKSPGISYYNIRVDIKDDNPQNNRYPFAINVLKRRLSVLYFTNRPSPTSGFLSRVMRRDPDIDFKEVVSFQRGSFYLVTDKGLKEFIWRRLNYDVLILDNIEDFGREEEVIDFVKLGGGLLILTGPDFKPNPLLSPILPCKVGDIIKREGSLELTPEGATKGIFYEYGRYLLEDLPQVFSLRKGSNIRGRVWAMDLYSKQPLILFRRVGRGKVLEFNLFPLWKIDMAISGIEKDPEPFRKFLVNSLRFLRPGAEKVFRLLTDKRVYLKGEPIRFTLKTLSATGEPVEGMDAYLKIPLTGIELAMREVSRGIYETDIDALPPGKYKGVVEGILNDKKIGTASVEFRVSEASLESKDVGLNSPLLKRLASLTKGRYFPYSRVPKSGIAVSIKKREKVIIFNPSTSLWVYLLFAALFGIEIFLRKKRGLP